MNNIPLDKNGRPLKGAALQAHLRKKLIDEYLEDSENQKLIPIRFSEEEKKIIADAAMDEKRLNLSLRKELRIISRTIVIIFSCGFLTLMFRPNYLPVGLILGVGIGGGVAIAQIEDEYE